MTWYKFQALLGFIPPGITPLHTTLNPSFSDQPGMEEGVCVTEYVYIGYYKYLQF